MALVGGFDQLLNPLHFKAILVKCLSREPCILCIINISNLILTGVPIQVAHMMLVWREIVCLVQISSVSTNPRKISMLVSVLHLGLQQFEVLSETSSRERCYSRESYGAETNPA